MEKKNEFDGTHPFDGLMNAMMKDHRKNQNHVRFRRNWLFGGITTIVETDNIEIEQCIHEENDPVPEWMGITYDGIMIFVH